MIFRQLTWIAVIITVTGCSTDEAVFDRVAIQGSVTLDGKPLEAGTIRFVPSTEVLGPKVTLSIQQGRFQCDTVNGPSVGAHRVEILLMENDQYAHDDEQALDRLKAQRNSRIKAPKLPAIYNDNSTLTATIEKDATQPLKFALKSKP